MRPPALLLVLLLILPTMAAMELVIQEKQNDMETGPVSQRYGLVVNQQSSGCFLACHNSAVQITRPANKTINSPLFITLNCENPVWVTIIGSCLPVLCKSAPDVAYGLEYANSWCTRAGVPDIKFPLPDWFLASPGGGYYNTTLISGARAQVETLGVMAATVVALGYFVYNTLV